MKSTSRAWRPNYTRENSVIMHSELTELYVVAFGNKFFLLCHKSECDLYSCFYSGVAAYSVAIENLSCIYTELT